MKILIVGAGIAGLSFAAFCEKLGLEYRIIDRAHEFKNIGYGLSIWPNGQKLLDKLALGELVDGDSYHLKNYKIANRQGRIIHSLDFSKINRIHSPVVGVERSKIHSRLLDQVGRESISYNTTVDIVGNSNDGVVVRFSNGDEENFDLVVGADGVHSKVRQQVFTHTQEENYGWTSWLFWLDSKFKVPEGIYQMIGPKAYVCFYPMSPKLCGIYMAAQMEPNRQDPFTTPSEKSAREKLIKSYFHDFGGMIPAIIETIDETEQMFHDDLRKIDADNWYKGRVALIGDAEHAISPLTGMGCSMALEDAYVLSVELAKAPDINTALRSYKERRLKRINKLQLMSDTFMGLVAVKSPIISWLETEVFSRLLPRNIILLAFMDFLNDEI